MLFAESTRKCEKCAPWPRGLWGECWFSGTQGQPAEFCQKQHGAVLMELEGMKGGWAAGLAGVPQGSTLGPCPEINGVWKNSFPYSAIQLKSGRDHSSNTHSATHKIHMTVCCVWACLENGDDRQSCVELPHDK